MRVCFSASQDRVSANAGRDWPSSVTSAATALFVAATPAQNLTLGTKLELNTLDPHSEFMDISKYDELKKEMARDRAKSVVLPMTHARPTPLRSGIFLAMLAIHMVVVGPPITLLVRDPRTR